MSWNKILREKKQIHNKEIFQCTFLNEWGWGKTQTLLLQNNKTFQHQLISFFSNYGKIISAWEIFINSLWWYVKEYLACEPDKIPKSLLTILLKYNIDNFKYFLSTNFVTGYNTRGPTMVSIH